MNSARTWRHAPHGETINSFLLTALTAMAEKVVTPSDTAFTIAVLSAHMVRPKETFSTLQPVTTWPEVASRAAPTANLE